MRDSRISRCALHPGYVSVKNSASRFFCSFPVTVSGRSVSFTNFIFDNDFSSFYTTYGPV